MPTDQEKEILPFVLTHLPDYFKEKARSELNETPERRIEGLKKIKEMTKKHKLTCEVQFVDDFLLQFLRHRKYDVSRAFNQLLNFSRFMKKHSSFFLSVDNDLFFSDPRRQFCTILPYRCPDGCVIALGETRRWNPEIISFEEAKQIVAALMTQGLRDPMSQINGIKFIADFTDTPLKYARYCTPKNMHLLYHGGMNCFPGRYKAFHLVSESPILKTALRIAKPLLTQKLKQRIFLSSNRTDLLHHFPASVLPLKYGGQLEDYYMMEFTEKANRQQEGFTLSGQNNYY